MLAPISEEGLLALAESQWVFFASALQRKADPEDDSALKELLGQV